MSLWALWYLMTTAVLHTERIEFAPWGIAIVKAAVPAQFGENYVTVTAVPIA
jgi:hypothetical protein